ncbi:MAG: DUF1553 domain-containing protein [Planctomycetaceae bacterium]|nr:DUF1553 domain-containing protein [Planctomycetaceae bacterium]MCB9951621.1 DUF1553 domain-containing protein [Planctomycetaceae bacterium]
MRRVIASLFLLAFSTLPVSAADPYGDLIRQDEPTAWWRFNGESGAQLSDSSANGLHAVRKGNVGLGIDGPQPSGYPDFQPMNTAASFPRGKNYLAVQDPGDNSALDFSNGDGLTIEAWVKLDEKIGNSYPYILGKGRTNNPGTSPKNQNYALRLASQNGMAAISFLFVDSVVDPDGTAIGDNGHRWTSTSGVPEDGFWHHVAVTYHFGEAKSLKGYIDGKPVEGVWDKGGETTNEPIVDNDELWIGSSMGGNSTLGGSLDEVALYRKVLSPDRIEKHAHIDIAGSLFVFGEVDETLVPNDKVRVEIIENIPVARKWTFRTLREPELLYETDRFALKNIPHKYNEAGLIIDRPVPSLVHMMSRVTMDAGEYEFILRSLDATRLYIDGELVAETGFKALSGDAHHPYEAPPTPEGNMLSLPVGHQEQRAKVSIKSGAHVVSVYRLLGNKDHGQHFGELVVGVAPSGQDFQVLSPKKEIAFTDGAWLDFLELERVRQRDWNQNSRLAVSATERSYWDQRHAYAREAIGPSVAVPPGDANNPVDRFILSRLSEQELKPTELVDDFAFLRRLSLDTTGRIPTAAEITEYLQAPAEARRALAVERFLNSSDWADHWVGYWQDVLAENPGLTKPSLNNSGPFRWFLYEAMLDNMPLDRFASEFALMRGSRYQGGPAGFAIASENDVPMAAKAHIMGTAFLAVEMKCARCHDAPYHDVQQKDLFGLAAMLKGGPEKVPGTSSVPVDPEGRARMNVKVTLPAGSSVKPDWAFTEFVSTATEGADSISPLPQELIRNPDDTREQLAAHLTSPHNTRFPRVIVNRVWQRFFGRGLIEPADDWENAECMHPELLDYLAQELVAHDYDLKYLSRVMLTSLTYQRATVPGLNRDSTEAAWFQGPVARKMTGEQVVDSLYRVGGKPLAAEELTIDADGRQDESRFGHLGIPHRAWQLVAVSNERDRPSMSLPVAQSINDLMAAYGWRQQRQEPLTVREDATTALQPLALAHGTAANRVIDYSDYSRLTAHALEAKTADEYVEWLFLTILTRNPTTEERELFADILRDGFDQRVVAGPEVLRPKKIFRTGITWATHFAPEADVEAVNRQREILEGDAPSQRLDADWRQRAEDITWVLLNSPEFVFVP